MVINVKSKIIWLFLIVIFVFGFAASYFLNISSFFAPQNKATYQAVFLANNQVYFGKLTSTSRSWLILKDVYYLEASSALQPENAGTLPPDQQKIQLVKLGGELHGPEDQMFINQDQVLYWENMKADSKVLEAIKKYQTSTP